MNGPRPRCRRSAAGESPLVTAILQALKLKGVWAWRANSGTQVLAATCSAQRRVIRGAPAGTPDVLLVLSSGRLCGIEVKTATGRLRPSQRAWANTAAAHAVRYALVRSIGEALDEVTGWMEADR